MFQNILFLCTGNVCRSPVAEAILKQMRPKLKVESAGIDPLQGQPIDEIYDYMLDKNNIYNNHTARLVDEKMVHQADIIIAMENYQIEVLLKQYPQVRGKMFLLGRWDNNAEIEDPYMRSRRTYKKVYKEIQNNLELWCETVFTE